MSRVEQRTTEVIEYEALVPIDHTGDRRIYPVGATIRLDHLSQDRVQKLIRLGYVRPIVRPIGSPVPTSEKQE